MPKAYILIGIPGSGKSTWIAKQPFNWDKTVIASTDNHVELFAKSVGRTYNEVFKEYMPIAVKLMANTVTNAVKSGYDIVWDQTSTTRSTRAKKIRMLPGYEIVAVVLPTPDDQELAKRLASRPGKNIPDEVIESMKNNWQEPYEDEGFDKIIYVE